MKDISRENLSSSQGLLLDALESLDNHPLQTGDIHYLITTSIEDFLKTIALGHARVEKLSTDIVELFLETGRFEFPTAASDSADCKDLWAFSSGQKKYLIQLRDTYAQLEHLPTDIQDDDLRAILLVGLNAYIFLFQSIFSGTEHDVFTSRVIQTLIRNSDFMAMRMEGLRSRLERSHRPHVHYRKCLMCDQDAIVLEANKAICLLCGFTMAYDKLSVLYGGLLGPCPKCDDGFLGFVPFDNDRVDAVCPLCGYVAGFCCLPHPHQGERHRVESYPRGDVNLESVCE